ncbi:MAG: peptidoglycan bridge formation glycyltransferase FemA/FemB family protein [Spirochaetes bacterium]|nr:peptidoglycan bridge formation glycyltransferase FemA/FemB family protein [Spirochaetota bacterium]
MIKKNNSKNNNIIVKNFRFDWNDSYTIFANENYLKLDCQKYNWLGGFIDNELKYVLPYKIFKKLFFKYAVFTSDTIIIDKKMKIDDEKGFLDNSLIYLKNQNIDFIIQPPTYAVFNVYPKNSLSAEFGSFVIDLAETEEKIWSNIHSKHKNVIRNAEKKGVIIKRGVEYLDTAYELYINTLKRSNINGSSKDKIINLVNNIRSNIEIFVAFSDGKAQGCAIMPYSSYSAYYIYGGSIEKPLTGAMNLLHWEALKYFKSKKVRFYDFAGARINPQAGTKYESLQKFKSRFGGSLKKGWLWKIPLNKFKYYFYNFILYTAKKRHYDIIDQIVK